MIDTLLMVANLILQAVAEGWMWRQYLRVR